MNDRMITCFKNYMQNWRAKYAAARDFVRDVTSSVYIFLLVIIITFPLNFFFYTLFLFDQDFPLILKQHAERRG